MRHRLITVLGFLAALCVLVWWISMIVRPIFETGSGGIGAVSSGVSGPLLLLLTILGLALVGLWTLVRAGVHAVLRITRSRN
jgi:hypothetical protein